MKAFLTLVILAAFLNSSFAGEALQQRVERTLENEFQTVDHFKVHRLAKAQSDESWAQRHGKNKRAKPLPLSRYIFVSAKGTAFYLTFAFARDPLDAQIAAGNYTKAISAATPPASKEYGADQLVAYNDSHQIGVWGSVCVAVYSPSQQTKIEMPEVLTTIEKLLNEKK